MTSKAEVVVYQKLVRDLVPERIVADGLVPVVRELSRDEYRLALRSKLCEEFRELRLHAMNEAPNAPELEKEAADVYEVLRAMAEEYGHQLDLLQYPCHRPEYPTFSLRMRRWHLFDVAIDAALRHARSPLRSLRARYGCTQNASCTWPSKRKKRMVGSRRRFFLRRVIALRLLRWRCRPFVGESRCSAGFFLCGGESVLDCGGREN